MSDSHFFIVAFSKDPFGFALLVNRNTPPPLICSVLCWRRARGSTEPLCLTSHFPLEINLAHLSLMLQLRQRLSELSLRHFLTTSITVSLLSSEMCRRSRTLRLRNYKRQHVQTFMSDSIESTMQACVSVQDKQKSCP